LREKNHGKFLIWYWRNYRWKFIDKFQNHKQQGPSFVLEWC